jgi:RNA polymerase-binding protein DksA
MNPDLTQQCKESLETQRTTLRRRVNQIESRQRQHNGPLSADFQEQATELENEEVYTFLGESGRVELVKVEKALHKIENDEFGYCEDCDGEIGEGRLRAVPYALFCIKCAEKREKRKAVA